MGTINEHAAAVTQILNKELKVTAEDLQILRKNTAGVPLLTGKSNYFVFRMEVELIDAIRTLDEA